MHIPNRIKTIRKNLDLKQTYVAYKMGITQQCYSVIESGKKSYTYNTIVKVAQALEINPLFILAGDIPITNETIDLFRRKTISEVVMKYLEKNSLFEDEEKEVLNPAANKNTI